MTHFKYTIQDTVLNRSLFDFPSVWGMSVILAKYTNSNPCQGHFKIRTPQKLIWKISVYTNVWMCVQIWFKKFKLTKKVFMFSLTGDLAFSLKSEWMKY